MALYATAVVGVGISNRELKDYDYVAISVMSLEVHLK